MIALKAWSVITSFLENAARYRMQPTSFNFLSLITMTATLSQWLSDEFEILRRMGDSIDPNGGRLGSALWQVECEVLQQRSEEHEELHLCQLLPKANSWAYKRLQS